MARTSLLHDDKPIKAYPMECGHEILLRTAPHVQERMLYCVRCSKYKPRVDIKKKDS